MLRRLTAYGRERMGGMADYIFTQNGDNNVQIGTDRLTGDFNGASMFATVEQARQYNKLRQYEDTGLTPDEIAALRAENERLGAELDRREIDPLKCPSCDEYRKETARLRADLAAMTAERDAAKSALDERNDLYARYHEIERKEWGQIQANLRAAEAERDAMRERAEAAAANLNAVKTCTNCCAPWEYDPLNVESPCNKCQLSSKRSEWRGPVAGKEGV